MDAHLSIADLMDSSGVGFGTSGARGLATAMTGRVCYAYTAAFLAHLRARGEAAPGTRVALAGDLRPSTPRILEACASAIADAGCTPVHCGTIPTPAVANYGLREGVPSLMVTGSHIPDDRNGIKFYRASGEILKDDEAGIRAQRVAVPAGRFDDDGALRAPGALPPASDAAHRAYVRRYLDFFPAGCLAGRRVALYEHSTVAREAFAAVLAALGAEVVPLGRSDRFVPVDTEAIRPEDVALAGHWAREVGFDAIVSADGDGDRPLVGDAQGRWLRGDVAGIHAARYLDADAVVTPVSSNTALEKCGWFPTIVRTRIGSPYVIAGMQAAAGRRVVGYEANGGFLTQSDIARDGRTLPALPTRDAVVVALAVLGLASQEGLTVAGLAGLLPPRYTASDRLKDFPTALSTARLTALQAGGAPAIEEVFAADFGRVASIDATDGLRITFASGEIAHLRASGNAPELRCYAEAGSADRAEAVTRRCLAILDTWRG
ncbi:MAG: phosphomannomutase [Gammaproteobacteria bacterium]|jgi:phosphomannomutase|nr:phosphomannomutase [Gammaproteobacteria bacterium]